VVVVVVVMSTFIQCQINIPRCTMVQLVEPQTDTINTLDAAFPFHITANNTATDPFKKLTLTVM